MDLVIAVLAYQFIGTGAAVDDVAPCRAVEREYGSWVRSIELQHIIFKLEIRIAPYLVRGASRVDYIGSSATGDHVCPALAVDLVGVLVACDMVLRLGSQHDEAGAAVALPLEHIVPVELEG